MHQGGLGERGRSPAAFLVFCVAFVVLTGVVTYIVTSSGRGAGEVSTPMTAAATHKAKGSAAAEPTTAPCQPAPLRERAAEVLVLGMPSVTQASDPMVDELLQLGVGGILLTGQNVVSRTQVSDLVHSMKARSRHPLLVSTDEETGRVSSFQDLFGTSLSARRLARQSTPAAVRSDARTVASSLSAMGIDLNLAPVVDLDDGPYSGIIGDRSFSIDPAVTSQFARAFAEGMADGKVLSAAKHFPGHGPATGDDHTGRVTSKVTMEELQGADLKPFADMIKAGVPVVMMANVDYAAIDSNIPASLSPRAYQLLRQMGFKGVAMTDSVAMGAVNQRWDVAEAAVAAIKAGADGVLMTDGSMARYQVAALVQAVQKHELDESRLNEAAARMIALAGGDPVAFACQPVELPTLHPSP